MASYFCVSSLLFAVIFIVKGSSLDRSAESGEERQCLEPPENVYYLDDTYGRPCERLAAAILQMYQWREDLLVEQYGSEMKEEGIRDIMSLTTVDIDDEEQVIEFVCRLEGVHTLDEATDAINGTQLSERIRNSYRNYQLFLSHVDGFHGFRMGEEVSLAYHNALGELTGKKEGEYLDVFEILHMLNVDNLADILSDLEDRFGAGYLVYFMRRPFNDALIGVDHRLLAQAIIDNNIACQLGVSAEIENDFNDQLTSIYFNMITREYVDKMLELYVSLDQMGLFSLA